MAAPKSTIWLWINPSRFTRWRIDLTVSGSWLSIRLLMSSSVSSQELLHSTARTLIQSIGSFSRYSPRAQRYSTWVLCQKGRRSLCEPPRYERNGGIIKVPVQLEHSGYPTTFLYVALDTGASRTVLDTRSLIAIGCDPTKSGRRIQCSTASGIEYLSLVVGERISALGQTRKNFEVLAHTLPPSTGVRGLLGMEFFDGRRLTLDDRNRILELE